MEAVGAKAPIGDRLGGLLADERGFLSLSFFLLSSSAKAVNRLLSRIFSTGSQVFSDEGNPFHLIKYCKIPSLFLLLETIFSAVYMLSEPLMMLFARYSLICL